MISAKFIGGPWDGMELTLDEVCPFYDIAECSDNLQERTAWTDAIKPVETKRVRYHLYDTWPVKYLVEGLK